MFLPGIDRRTVSSLWTPNTRVMQITEEGFEARGRDRRRHHAGRSSTPAKIAKIRNNAIVGGYVGSAGRQRQLRRDGRRRPARRRPASRKQKLDYLDLAPKLEHEVRAEARGRRSSRSRSSASPSRSATSPTARRASCAFFALAFVLTALAVYVVLPLVGADRARRCVCSLVSLVWQFGTLHAAGLRARPAGGPGAVPGVRHRRVARRAADQLHLQGDLRRRRHR